MPKTQEKAPKPFDFDAFLVREAGLEFQGSELYGVFETFVFTKRVFYPICPIISNWVFWMEKKGKYLPFCKRIGIVFWWMQKYMKKSWQIKLMKEILNENGCDTLRAIFARI